MIFQIFTAIMLIINAYIICANVTQKQLKLLSFLPIFVAVAVFYPIMYLAVPQEHFSDVLILSGHALASFLCIGVAVKNKKSSVLYIAFLYFGLLVTASALVNWIVSTSLDGGVDVVYTDFFANLTFLSICAIASRRGRLFKITQGLLQKQTNIKILLITTVWASALLASFIYYYFQTYHVDSAIILIIAIFSVVLMVLLGILFPKLIISSLTGAYYKNLSMIMDDQVKAQVEHYEAMVKANEDIKRFRHDYNNLKLVLADALRRSDLESALALLADDEMAQVEGTFRFNTGNIILDALLNEKQHRAKKSNTQIIFEGVVPEKALRSIDVCKIFGNALDNAIEACEKCPAEQEKEIAIISKYVNNFLFVEIKNPTAEKVEIVNNRVETTKQEKAIHGIGLRSMRTAVERYGGEVNLDYADGFFSVSLDLDFNSL